MLRELKIIKNFAFIWKPEKDQKDNENPSDIPIIISRTKIRPIDEDLDEDEEDFESN